MYHHVCTCHLQMLLTALPAVSGHALCSPTNIFTSGLFFPLVSTLSGDCKGPAVYVTGHWPGMELGLGQAFGRGPQGLWGDRYRESIFKAHGGKNKAAFNLIRGRPLIQKSPETHDGVPETLLSPRNEETRSFDVTSMGAGICDRSPSAHGSFAQNWVYWSHLAE